MGFLLEAGHDKRNFRAVYTNAIIMLDLDVSLKNFET